MEMAASMMENGLKTICMDKAQSFSPMVKFNTKGDGKGVRGKERELCFGSTMEQRCMWERGSRAVDTDREHLTMKGARSTKVSGLTMTGKVLEANSTMMEH